jgi:hypothetical protein
LTLAGASRKMAARAAHRMSSDDAPELPPFHLRVETAAGAGGEPMPHRFFLRTRAVTVIEVVDRWLGSDHRYYKVRGDDGDLYILRHDADDAHWELTLYAGAGSPLADE